MSHCRDADLADAFEEVIDMNEQIIDFARDEDHLGILAMRFRSTRDEEERKIIAEEYAQTVNRLIRSRRWHEAPAFEDQLPDAWMPKAFSDYWYDGLDLD